VLVPAVVTRVEPVEQSFEGEVEAGLMDHHEVGKVWEKQEDRFEVGPESVLPVGVEVSRPGQSQVEVAAVLPEVACKGMNPGMPDVDGAALGKGDVIAAGSQWAAVYSESEAVAQRTVVRRRYSTLTQLAGIVVGE
jgi:hypothetical protein